MPPGLEAYTLDFDPIDFHQLLRHAAFVLTEGASTATEAVCLGVPALFINSVGRLGNFDLLEGQYKLLKTFTGPDDGIPEAIRLLESIASGNEDIHTLNYMNFISNLQNTSDYVVEVLERSSLSMTGS